ncbi:MAG: nitrite/sulfite reductase [Candidatus Schekmanbacteria bacterium]|nr:nitrite/sulfite reductase [Candidatus Schekmanbacteria bacterium]
MSVLTWSERLGSQMPADWARQIDVFETQMQLRRQSKMEERVFSETRLRRGVYGQRYDNGQRHDGQTTQHVQYPCGSLTKGPDTIWDAPGMQRVKLPMGRLTVAQMEVLAELAEEYSDGILHVTTRQDVQLHFVHIDDTPDLMRRLAAVGITTLEACGNSVRNVTACPCAGVCATEAFDVTPYAHALAFFLLGHRDVQDFGRKFKIAFSGCADEACGLTNFHCLGAQAVSRAVEGTTQHGFRIVVGGGLGAVPRAARVLTDFAPEAELLPIAQAVCRVYARLGEKENRSRARIKFLVDKLGIEEFRKLVFAEREKIPDDERWTTFLSDLDAQSDRPKRPGARLAVECSAADFTAWRTSNVKPQRQEGYAVATVRLPLGDATAHQFRRLADLARTITGDTVRTTAEQNIVFRWVPEAALPEFYQELREIGLDQPGAGTIADITACPGTDTCKLGISSSRGLARVLESRLAHQAATIHPEVAKLRIKTSGCFNSCGQHHVADIGFLGVSRNVGGRRVAHFQLVVGGQWAHNGGSFGLAIGAFPSRRVPEVLHTLTARVHDWRHGRWGMCRRSCVLRGLRPRGR